METIITRIRTKQQRWGMPLTMTMEQLANEIRDSRHELIVKKIERLCTLVGLGENADNLRLSKQIDRLPYIIFSAQFNRKGVDWFGVPSGLKVLRDILGTLDNEACTTHSRIANLDLQRRHTKFL